VLTTNVTLFPFPLEYAPLFYKNVWQLASGSKEAATIVLV